MKIVIIGDSWGCGEWVAGHARLPGAKLLNHRGLEEYLIEQGHEVVNLSHGGSSNTQSYQHLESYLIRFQDVDHCFAFQTEYTRCSKYAHDEDLKRINTVNDLASIWLARYYGWLSKISVEHNVPISIIGGAGDTVWFEKFEETYPGVCIACQSLTNLILNKDHRIDNPVFSVYTNSSREIVEELKNILSPTEVENLINDIDRGARREILWGANPDYFWPDGVHPNRIGHKILFDHIKQLGII